MPGHGSATEAVEVHVESSEYRLGEMVVTEAPTMDLSSSSSLVTTTATPPIAHPVVS